MLHCYSRVDDMCASTCLSCRCVAPPQVAILSLSQLTVTQPLLALTDTITSGEITITVTGC
jgi:hypothetical protein